MWGNMRKNVYIHEVILLFYVTKSPSENVHHLIKIFLNKVKRMNYPDPQYQAKSKL